MIVKLAVPQRRSLRGARGRGMGSVFDPSGGLVSDSLISWLSTPSPPPTVGAVSTPSLLWNWITSGAGISQGCMPWDITCANKPAMIAQEQAQIQNVADRAKFYYGGDSQTAQVAQTFADQQKALAPGDVATITASQLSVGPFSLPWWIWAVAGGGALWYLTRK